MTPAIQKALKNILSEANYEYVGLIDDYIVKQSDDIYELIKIVHSAGYCFCPHCEEWSHVDCVACQTGDDDDCPFDDESLTECPNAWVCSSASLALECCMYPTVKWERFSDDGIRTVSSQKYEVVNFSNIDWAWGARHLKNTWR